MWPFGAPVVLGDADGGARVVLGHPVAQLRDVPDHRRDPAVVDVGRVPQRPRRLVAPRLHRRRGVVAELAALRVVVGGEDVEEPPPLERAVLLDLLQQPRQVVHLAVAGSIRQRRPGRPAVRVAVLLVVAGQLRAEPPPLFGPDHRGARVGVFHLARVGEHVVAHFLHRGAGRVHVAMRLVPERRARCRGCSTSARRWRPRPSA